MGKSGPGEASVVVNCPACRKPVPPENPVCAISVSLTGFVNSGEALRVFICGLCGVVFIPSSESQRMEWVRRFELMQDRLRKA